MIAYSKKVEKLFIIVYSPIGYKPFSIGENIFIYPTNSRSKINFIFDAYKIGKVLGVQVEKSNTVVTTQDPFETGLVGLLLKRKFGFGLNIQIHTNPFSPFFRYENFLNFVRYIFFRFFLLSQADSIRTVSKNVQEKLEHLGKKGKVINIPIIKEIKNGEQKTKKHKGFHILSLSRLEKVKNISGIITSIKELSKECPDIHLDIVGRGTEEKALRKLSQSYNLGEKITFWSWTDSVGDFYNSSDLFVLNSLYEGWGMTVIEAASYGVPIIMTNTGCAGDFLINNHNGIVIDIGDQEQLTDAIKRMYTDADFRGECIRNSLESVKNLPNKEETLELYYQSWKIALPNPDTHAK